MVSRVDEIPDGRPIHVKSIYKCGFKNIRICANGAFHDSVNLQIWPESFHFFISFIIILISNFLEIDFAINISDKKSRRFDLSEVIFKCIKVL